jgi:CheY-like chemotaxis protein
VINRIFAEKGQERPDSKIISSGVRRQTELASQILLKADRLKSYLAGNVHVLVVEDNRVNQIVAKNLLAEAGFTCDIAQNGIEACSAVRNEEYDVVLMDCQMPEMDGYEATRLIRNWEREHGKKHLPIIALTANATKEDVRKCFDAGMDAYCSKPISPLAVIRLIEEWYEKSGEVFAGK